MSEAHTPPTPRARRGVIARTPRWVLLAAFWLVQAVVLWEVQGFSYAWSASVGETHFWGEIPPLRVFVEAWTDPQFVAWMSGTLLVVTAAQALMVWPVRAPGVSSGKGRSVRSSLFAAGGVIGFLLFAFVAAVVEVSGLDGPNTLGGAWGVFALCLALGWAVATPLLIAFSRPGPREDIVARLARRILAGTIIEVALIIPLDVIVRRRGSCYCAAGTYWALTICGFVGVIVLGPAVLCPLLAKRRKAWYGGHCGVCGYDMSGSPDAARCPECGTGWKEGG